MNRYRRAVDTRLLYRWEKEFKVSAFAETERSMEFLQEAARTAWAYIGYGYRACPPPTVVAGRGTVYNGRFYSYTINRNRIVLARHERNVKVLFHELAHALGFDEHDARFVRQYFDLLVRFAGCSHIDLLFSAKQIGVRV